MTKEEKEALILEHNKEIIDNVLRGLEPINKPKTMSHSSRTTSTGEVTSKMTLEQKRQAIRSGRLTLKNLDDGINATIDREARK